MMIAAVADLGCHTSPAVFSYMISSDVPFIDIENSNFQSSTDDQIF
jgi:hypothetical protein